MTSQPLDAPAAGEPAPRSRRWTWLGAVVLVVGLVLGPTVVAAAIWLFPDVGSFPRATGERAPVELTAGDWTVFVEGGLQPPLAIEDPNGAPVALRPISSNQSYSLSGRSGEAVGSITAPIDGTYQVTSAPGQTIAFGQQFGRRLAASIVTGVLGGLLAFGCIAVGLLVLVVDLISGRRHRSTDTP